MTATDTDPAAIEQDIRRTQNDMSSTIEKIGDQLSIKNLFNAVLDKADNSNIDARTLVDGARRNPIALGLIAFGAIWLISDKDSKLPTFGAKSQKAKTTFGDDFGHDDYMSHMSGIQQYAGEDEFDYQRRKDVARSDFFGLKRSSDEDDSSFRQRLDGMTAKLSEKRQAWAESSAEKGALAKQKIGALGNKSKDLYAGNPLVAGLIFAAIGAALGSALQITEQERNKLGPLGKKVRSAVDQNVEKAVSQLRDKKDELLNKGEQQTDQSPHFA